jgi:hypothetical protein
MVGKGQYDGPDDDDTEKLFRGVCTCGGRFAKTNELLAPNRMVIHKWWKCRKCGAVMGTVWHATRGLKINA